jgi:cold shock CspA family protein
MTGFVARVSSNKGFGFIRGDDNKEYFFHRQDFIGIYETLVKDYEAGRRIYVKFDSIPSDKGPRASNVDLLP